MGKTKLNEKDQAWVEARKRHRLSHALVQMARELGMNPKKLGKIDNHAQQPWKAPLPEFIEHLYLKSFGKQRPDQVVSVEHRASLDQQKKAARRLAKAARKAQNHSPPGDVLDGQSLHL